ncbi:caM kinase-like vesicle-associated protein [Sinocyclocheilus rhinocerous]|uniref:caM kinase-like vesicle-associated protein n=1 Tax=Sinocyclocheilus rhinocerous TaxID=307959 RepID=UPI0007BA415D|nr:PREDICTED: caM kinase-like vesicle-associated protein [Sinocyclocheilus rhinocerous]
MPFGCLTLGEKKDYNSPSEVTDKYDLGQVVKSEEFCEIFRAKDKNTLKMYTCKKFLKKDGRKVRKAAKNEILILKMVKHHNILQLVDVFETRKEYFLFLELATGREVFDWILDQGYYSERDTSNVIRQVLEAVAYLHSFHIVHRNLKVTWGQRRTKAVRVTTMMKRLRAPDQSDSGASSPAMGASGGPVTPSTTPVPLAATPMPPRTTLDHPEAQTQEASAPTRCNGEILTSQQRSEETREE